MLCYVFIHSKELCTNILLFRTLLKQEKIDILQKGQRHVYALSFSTVCLVVIKKK